MARVLLSLEMVESNTETMATDGQRILWNRSFAESISSTERDGVRVHECLHILLGHHVRRGEREPMRWNAACDYEINPYVETAGYALPAGALLDIKYAGMSAEEIYEQLPKNTSECAWGQVHDGQGDPHQAREEWRKLVASVQWSDIPEALARTLGALTEPKVDLAERIANWLTAKLPTDDETWLPPSRRYNLLPSDTVKPGGYVVLCVDTSGSIGKDQLTEFASAATTLAGIGQIDVIFGDCTVSKIIGEIDSKEDIISAFEKAEGGGGTDFRPLLREAESRFPDAVIYLTDGYGDFGKPVQVPVLWVMNSEVIAPWGETVKLS